VGALPRGPPLAGSGASIVVGNLNRMSRGDCGKIGR